MRQIHPRQSSFARSLQAGRFVLTGEIAPPKGSSLEGLRHTVQALVGVADAVNVTDNQRAVMRMGNLAVGALLVQAGIEPILQKTCRDRNSIALQSDLLAAEALGIENILALTGDPVSAGDHPDARSVFELSSVELLRTIACLNRGESRSGKSLQGATSLFAGAACDPTARNNKGQLAWMERKVEAGARFFQTQAVYNPVALETFVRATEPFGQPILAGILFLKSAKMARFLNDKVPGIQVPENHINRLERAEDPVEVGIEIAEELMHDVAPMVQGLHVMSVGQEDLVVETLRRYRRDYLS